MAATAPVATYFQEGARRARALGNRGPLRFDSDGRLAADIAETYADVGFYVFEGVIDSVELAELQVGLDDLLERMPDAPGATVDRSGRPLERGLPNAQWAEPLSDPWGGTDLLNGRHPVPMEELGAAASTEPSIFLLLGVYEAMPAAMRLSAHPQMLRVAESLMGADFVPYNDSFFVKEPGLGAAVSWHQDGTTHWDNPDWHPDIHGVNFMAQLCRTTPANALWVVPGSHRLGHIDIAGLVDDNGGSTRLPDAVPMLCEPGDIAICNRQCLHGSFANASPDPRATFVWGFFRLDAVLGAEVDLPAVRPGQAAVRRRWTEADIADRAALVQLAIDARAAHRPDEAPYIHEPGRAAPPIKLEGYRLGTIFL